MRNLFIAFLFPLLSFGQTEQYFFLQTEVDARNAIFGGTVNDPGYNGVFKAGFSAQWFRADIFYEFFRDLNYETSGVNLTYLLFYDRPFKAGAGIQISVINKPKKLTPSLGLNGMLEYHFGQFFVSARTEVKMRTDWDITVYSGFMGVGIKL